MNNNYEGPRNFNKDPHLGRDDNIQNSNDNSTTNYEEAMKDMPSFEEHMEQMQAEQENEDENEMTM